MAEHTHEYDCRVCGAHLDSQRELDEHNRRHHPGTGEQSAPGMSASSGTSSSGRSGHNR